ncbi:hypothetical protein PLICRDRAFT_86139 [Plicaturopsis crispa FD-325 SS-3]|nr:hypothetical protein PLICRDRAFT_86139 [Plicaturopsis crispa FD-325 SS-3]
MALSTITSASCHPWPFLSSKWTALAYCIVPSSSFLGFPSAPCFGATRRPLNIDAELRQFYDTHGSIIPQAILSSPRQLPPPPFDK